MEFVTLTAAGLTCPGNILQHFLIFTDLLCSVVGEGWRAQYADQKQLIPCVCETRCTVNQSLARILIALMNVAQLMTHHRTLDRPVTIADWSLSVDLTSMFRRLYLTEVQPRLADFDDHEGTVRRNRELLQVESLQPTDELTALVVQGFVMPSDFPLLHFPKGRPFNHTKYDGTVKYTN